jgi:hypothetical protein
VQDRAIPREKTHLLALQVLLDPQGRRRSANWGKSSLLAIGWRLSHDRASLLGAKMGRKNQKFKHFLRRGHQVSVIGLSAIRHGRARIRDTLDP